MLEENELRFEIESFILTLEDKTSKQIGKVMGHLKSKFPGVYDGAMASKIVKDLLK